MRTSVNPVRTAHRAVVAASAIGAVVAALLAAAPAQAATALPVITLQSLPTLALPAGPATVQPNFSFTTNAKSLHVDDATITVDARGLAKVAKVSFSGNCTVKSLVATCSELFWDDTITPHEGLGAMTQMTLTALKGAKLGAVGTYKVTGHSAKATIVGRSSSVVVGGPALALKQPPNHTKLKIGSTVSEPVQFTNIGNRPASSAKVLLMTSPGLTFATHYANCEYGTMATGAGSTLAAVCSPKGAIKIGEEAELSAPVGLRVTKTALYTYLDVVAFGSGDDSVPAGVKWAQGKGKTLGLKVLKAGHTSSAPVGNVSLPLSGKNSEYQIARLQAKNTADFGVTGASRTAAKGSTTTFAFTGYANGPATLYDRSGGEGVPAVIVTPPPGTTVVSSSANCQPWQGDNAQATAHGPYVCGFGSIVIPKGLKVNFSLKVRVDTVTPGAKGSVTLSSGPEVTSPYTFAYDTYHANDTAVLHLN